MEKNVFFAIPEMPSKTLVMVLKNFLVTLSLSVNTYMQGLNSVGSVLDVEHWVLVPVSYINKFTFIFTFSYFFLFLLSLLPKDNTVLLYYLCLNRIQ